VSIYTLILALFSGKLNTSSKTINYMDEDKITKQLEKQDAKLDKVEDQLDKVTIKQIQLEEDVKDIKEKVKKLDGWDNLMNGQDRIIKLLEEKRTEDAAVKSRMDRFENRLDEHGKKTTTLETQPQIA